jgi:ketosteroid isomerase-like protein
MRVVDCQWVENLQSKIIGKMGFVAGMVELKVEVKGQPKTVRFRGTFVMQEETDEKWRIVHEHFSQPAENPYGFGDWLKSAQS